MLHCDRCPAHLCEACDDQVHSANRIVSKHMRTPLADLHTGLSLRTRLGALRVRHGKCTTMGGIHHPRIQARLGDHFSLLSYCTQHPTQTVSYYCKVCATPVCVDCKMAGSHAVGEFATHTLYPIGTWVHQKPLCGINPCKTMIQQ